MKILRTPAERFVKLPDYPFKANYCDVGDGIRMHYVDEGPKNGQPILMLHGEPSWSYLYRKMIPLCVVAGHRVIAPDLIGFGKSDKPSRIEDYTYGRHVGWLHALVAILNLDRITLVAQDWGSLLGLRLAAEAQDKFARIVVGNGMLPTGDQKIAPAFFIWQAFAKYSPILPISGIVQLGTRRKLSAAEKAAYDAPFVNHRYKAGTRAFPLLVPTKPNNPASQANREAWKVLERWQKPFLTTFSDGDPITRGADSYLQKRIPGAKGQPHITLRGGHFLQEDSPAEFAAAINQLIAATPL